MDEIGQELLQPQPVGDTEMPLILMAHQYEALDSEPAHMDMQEPNQTTTAYSFIDAYPSARHEYDITTSVAAITNSRTSASNLLPTFSPTPDQKEIETWLVEYQKQRRSSRSQEGLAAIVCPLPDCGQGLRRPHALKDHLFFHFDIRRTFC
ncbi:hypothetical protein FRC12_022108 [Ceratobasidium sp. 428]|nr:hypothetical protein FRC12_022108 [Ceratobasidium sp. 428]